MYTVSERGLSYGSTVDTTAVGNIVKKIFSACYNV